MAEPSKHDRQRTSTARGMHTAFKEHSEKQNSSNLATFDWASKVSASIVAWQKQHRPRTSTDFGMQSEINEHDRKHEASIRRS
jgi:hypothetical protein